MLQDKFETSMCAFLRWKLVTDTVDHHCEEGNHIAAVRLFQVSQNINQVFHMHSAGVFASLGPL